MTDLKTSVLVDTNILVYIYDKIDPIKQKRAFDVLDQLITESRAVLNSQILGEFFNVVTRSKAGKNPILNQSEAVIRIQTYISICEILPITAAVVKTALYGFQVHQFSYWDAQIWACAKVNGIPEIYSEDFASSSVVENVTFKNPLFES